MAADDVTTPLPRMRLTLKRLITGLNERNYQTTTAVYRFKMADQNLPTESVTGSLEPGAGPECSGR